MTITQQRLNELEERAVRRHMDAISETFAELRDALFDAIELARQTLDEAVKAGVATQTDKRRVSAANAKYNRAKDSDDQNLLAEAIKEAERATSALRKKIDDQKAPASATPKRKPRSKTPTSPPTPDEPEDSDESDDEGSTDVANAAANAAFEKFMGAMPKDKEGNLDIARDSDLKKVEVEVNEIKNFLGYQRLPNGKARFTNHIRGVVAKPNLGAALLAFTLMIFLGIVLGMIYNWGFLSLATPLFIVLALIAAGFAAGIQRKDT